jgi:hypothetical protein
MKTITVTLGDKPYEVQSLPIRKARAWRKKFAEPFNLIVGTLEAMPNVEITKPEDLGLIVRSLSEVLLGSVDMLVDMLFDFSPALAADRENILDRATDDEAVRAFVEVLKLAYPLVELVGVIKNVLQPTAQPPTAS